MFEAEVEMEKKSSNWVPLVLIIALIAAVIGLVGYAVFPMKKALSAPEAAEVVTAALQAQGPAVVHFHSGLVAPSVDEKPRDPHYRLLEKAGVLKLVTAPGGAMRVSLTPLGEQELAEIGAKKLQNPDRTDAYTAPLAERKLVEVSKVTMRGRNAADVEYTWKWAPNRLGEAFDAAGPTIKKFNTWEHATLIQKYGVDFYHGAPTRATLILVRSDKGWRISTE